MNKVILCGMIDIVDLFLSADIRVAFLSAACQHKKQQRIKNQR